MNTYVKCYHLLGKRQGLGMGSFSCGASRKKDHSNAQLVHVFVFHDHPVLSEKLKNPKSFC